MNLRRLLFWFHLVVGVTVGLTIGFFASTGSLMAFQDQIVRYRERTISVPEHPQGTCLAPGALLRQLQGEVGSPLTSLMLFSDIRIPAQVSTAPDRIFLTDPCTGVLLQGGPSRVRAFFAHVRDLHRYAAFGGTRYQTLHAITIAGNLGFPVLILSGLVLWVPRQWKQAHLRNALTLRGGLKARAREWNLHTVGGFWLALPLLVMSLSGSVMAYDWVNALLYRAAGSPAPAQGKEERPKVRNMGNVDLLDKLIPRAKEADSRWYSLTVRFPISGANGVPFALDEGTGSRPQQKTQLILSKDGKLTRFDTFDRLPRGRQWRLYGRFLHTGEIFGWPGQALAFLAALMAVLLVWTGFALSVRRFAAWRRRKVRAKQRSPVFETA